MIFLITIPFLLRSQSLCFTNVPNTTNNINPYTITSADFNEDGILDIGYCSTGDSVYIVLGVGGGSLGVTTKYLTGTSPNYLITSDFNNDGHADLAMENMNALDNISVLLGNGDGTFFPVVNYITGGGGREIIAKDFNEDNNIDLAAVDVSQNTITLLLGNGDGTFGPSTHFLLGNNSPQSLVSEDFNNDGNLDIATINSGSSSISVIFGSGTGSFGPATHYPDHYGNMIRAGDFNQDGIPDLAEIGSGNNVGVMLGNVGGTFSPNIYYPIGNSAISMAIGDFNGDGNLDIGTANTSSIISIILGDGAGSFNSTVNYISNTATSTAISAADFDGDSKLDFAAHNLPGHSLSVFINCNNIGINTISENQSILSYFDPIKRSIILLPSSEKYKRAKIFDLQGRCIVQKELINIFEMELLDIDSGVYTLLVELSEGNYVQKILIPN